MQNATTVTRKSCRAASRAISTAAPTANSRRARARWPMRWLPLASSLATAWPPWPGTATVTWSCTTQVSGSGAVLHTLNPRLHPDQVVYIADHAEDQVLSLRPDLPADHRGGGFQGEDHQEVCRHDRPRPHAGQQQGAGFAVLRRPVRPRRTIVSTGPISTRTAPRRCATRRAPPATPRGCCTATARPCCTR